MLENSKHIIIVGAGIAGLTAALSLRHYGIRTSIYERSPEIITAGAGIQLSPNANRVLSRIGVLKEISSVSIRCHGVKVFDYKSNRQLALFDYMKFKGNDFFYFCHRADLVGVLYAACQKLEIPVYFNKKLEKIINKKAVFSDGETLSAELILEQMDCTPMFEKPLLMRLNPYLLVKLLGDQLFRIQSIRVIFLMFH